MVRRSLPPWGDRSITFNMGRGTIFHTLPLSGNATAKSSLAPLLRPKPARHRLGFIPSFLLAEPAKALKNAEASAALAQASERPGGRPKGADEVPSVLAGPDIVRSSAAQRFADVQDNCGGVGQSELVLAGE